MPTRKHVEAALNSLSTASKDIRSVIEQTLERIVGQNRGSRSLAMRILSWTACCRYSLSLSELQHAIAVDDKGPSFDQQKIPEIEGIISVCFGLVLFHKSQNAVRLAHDSNRAWLQENWKNWLPHAEKDIASTCITYLTYTVFEDGPCTSHDAYKLRLRSYPLLRYATCNWGYHAITCNLEGTSLILDFLANPAKLLRRTRSL